MTHVRATFLLLALAAMTAGCGDAGARRCFSPDTVLPQRAETLADPTLGGSGRALAEALFDRDRETAEQLLARDPALARARVGAQHDMLVVALATCDRALVDLLLTRGAPPDGAHHGVPLAIALRAEDPWFALRLLEGGAHPVAAPDGGNDPVRTAIELNSAGGVRMLLDHGADVNRADALGDRPLQMALDMERFGIAELLLDRGADPWATDSGGATLGWSVTRPMVGPVSAEQAAQTRLAERTRRLGWPQPAPDPRAVRAAALAGQWPPVKGAPAVPQAVLKIMRENAARR